MRKPSGENRSEAARVEAAEVESDMGCPVVQPVFGGAAQGKPLVARPRVDIEHADDGMLRAFQIDGHALRTHFQTEQPVVERDRGAMDGDPIELAQKGVAGAPSVAGLEQLERPAAIARQTDA